MVKSFRSKLTLAFLATIALLLITLVGLGYLEFRNYYLNNLEARLTKEAYLVADSTNYRVNRDGTLRSYQDICITAAQDSSTRVTIIDGDGTVLGDSEVAPEQLENHSSRPEIYTALHGGLGTAIRFSDTLGMNMLYVAVPFNNNEKNGAIRLAMPMADLQDIYNHALMGIVAAALMCGLLALLLSFLMIQYFSRPVREITAAVQDMGRGNLRRRVSWHTNDEMGVLAQTFNDMGQHVEENLQQISEVKNRLEAILYNTINGIMLIGEKERLVYANPTAYSLLGISENSIGRKYAEVISAYEILTMIDQAVDTAQPVKRVVILYNGRGSRTIDANVVPIASKGSGQTDILLVLNDITEMKRLEQVRKDFIANVSHELKTPVTAIMGFAETLLDEGCKDPANTLEFSRIIYDESQRLAHLINGLLTLSKLESAEVRLDLRAAELKSLMAETIARMEKLAGIKNISIVYNAPAPVVLNTDPEMIDQILTNLLDNAIKYSPEGSRIKVDLEASSDRVIIMVKDNGIGIPAAELPRIFERFYRVDKARSRKTGGSGLGLSIVKHLVENLHGEVSAASTDGQGSTFTVVLFK